MMGVKGAGSAEAVRACVQPCPQGLCRLPWLRELALPELRKLALCVT